MNAKEEEKKIYPGGPEDTYNEALKESLNRKTDLHKLSLQYLDCDVLGNFLRRYMMANIPNKALGNIPFETVEEIGKHPV